MKMEFLQYYEKIDDTSYMANSFVMFNLVTPLIEILETKAIT